ncbi:MAG TPA: glycosyltransferase family 4 protein [Aggregatilineaceae bacterium]|nr:glycosyltransferase family 4 protein [Aggregatilineaceae bacterium]
MITGQYPPQRGGIGDYTDQLVSALQDKGVEVSLIVPSGSVLNCQDKVSLLPVGGWGWSTLRIIARHLTQSESNWLHIQYQPNIYHGHPAICMLPLFLRTRRWGGRIAVTFHDLQVPHLFRKAGLLRALTRDLLVRTAAVSIAADTGDYEYLRRIARRVLQIPIGSNIPYTSYENQTAKNVEIRRRYAIAPDKAVIGQFGTTSGLETLLYALKDVPGTVLMMIGKEISEAGNDAAEIVRLSDQHKALIRDLGVTERVCFTGYLPAREAAYTLQSVDVVVLPYAAGASLRNGGFMAALTQGTAIITTQPRYPIPHLTIGEHLLTVPPGDASALARMIHRTLGDAALCEKLRENARQVAHAVFSWPTIAAAHMTIYQGEHSI